MKRPVLWIIVGIVVIVGIAWAVRNGSTAPAPTDDTLQTTGVRPADGMHTAQPAASGTASATTSTSADIDGGITSIDDTLNGVDDNDFSADQLSDQSLQLQ